MNLCEMGQDLFITRLFIEALYKTANIRVSFTCLRGIVQPKKENSLIYPDVILYLDGLVYSVEQNCFCLYNGVQKLNCFKTQE